MVSTITCATPFCQTVTQHHVFSCVSETGQGLGDRWRSGHLLPSNWWTGQACKHRDKENHGGQWTCGSSGCVYLLTAIVVAVTDVVVLVSFSWSKSVVTAVKSAARSTSATETNRWLWENEIRTEKTEVRGLASARADWLKSWGACTTSLLFIEQDLLLVCKHSTLGG